MKNLDDLIKIKKLDSLNMLGNVLAVPEMLKTGVKLGQTACIPSNYKKANKIVFTGLGGSAIGGDILKALLNDHSAVSVTVNRNYHLPGWVDANTLVIAVSYSGNTEETVSAFKDAVAKKAKIIVVTAGGKLKEYAEKYNLPLVLVPGGNPPRASLAFLFFPVLMILRNLGFVKIKDSELAELEALLEKQRRACGPEVKTNYNPAKKLASKLYGRPVLFFGSADFTDAVTTRWKCQFAENSKVLGFSCTIPEMNHNEIVSWKLLKNVLSKFAVLFIQDKDEIPQIKKRFMLTKEVVSKKAGWTGEVKSAGVSRLSRLFSLIYLGDFVSVYLALLYDEDPTEIKIIEDFKNALSK